MKISPLEPSWSASMAAQGYEQAAIMGGIPADSDDAAQCGRCGHRGCDVRILGCGCTLHARCTQLPTTAPMSNCPRCGSPASGLVLFPMSFREIDEARRSAAAGNSKRGRKRKEAGKSDQDAMLDKFGDPSDRRTGRWTSEEMAYCDKLIEKFKDGQLPIVDGVKLNDFLGNMLKSKQSRLTKKMKNANLSSKSFKHTSGFIEHPHEAQAFAELEESFYQAIQSQQERAEMRFHIQKEWRELFSSYCVSLGQPLDADAWLSSVEEMDRRAAQARDNARMAKRRLMMNTALTQDAQNPDRGVFIESAAGGQQSSAQAALLDSFAAGTDEFASLLGDKNGSSLTNGKVRNGKRRVAKNSYDHRSPFLSKVIALIQGQGVPFEHVDVWVPSFVPATTGSEAADNAESKCRLCFAGCATSEIQVSPTGEGPPQVLSQEEHFCLYGFGEYSQKFSFNVGCGLPGRVYQSGVPTWEQSVQNAPHHHFERCGGAMQWGIKTVVGLPIPSPNVGRIVVVMYSRHNRPKNQELVGQLCEEFTKFMPAPKWKLVVDLGETKPVEPTSTSAAGASVGASASAEDPSAAPAPSNDDKGSRINEIVTLLGEHMPSDPSSQLASYLPGFMSLRLMLLRNSHTQEEEGMIQTLLSSYASYSVTGRSQADIALMLARDFIFLKQHTDQQAANQAQAQGNANNSSSGQPLIGQTVTTTTQVPNQSQQLAPMSGLGYVGASPLLDMHQPVPTASAALQPLNLLVSSPTEQMHLPGAGNGQTGACNAYPGQQNATSNMPNGETS